MASAIRSFHSTYNHNNKCTTKQNPSQGKKNEKNTIIIKKVNFKRHPERIPKPPVSNQNLFSRFQSLCCTVVQKMKTKDEDILGIFDVKESSNLIGRENFRDNHQEPDC